MGSRDMCGIGQPGWGYESGPARNDRRGALAMVIGCVLVIEGFGEAEG